MVGVEFQRPRLSHPLQLAFLKWQCRVRQIMMREQGGRPDAGVMPDVTLAGDATSLGTIITVMSRRPQHSVTPELKHMVRRTHDPAQRRAKALEFLSEHYYQRADRFDGRLTATFVPGSVGAETLGAAGGCTLIFSSYGQSYELACRVRALEADDPLYEATWWHNALFNPGLPADTTVLVFEPDWDNSQAIPEPPGLR